MDSSVQLMATCILDTLYPEVAEAVVEILEQVGLHVEFPLAQTCCGQPAYNAGMRSQARQMAEHTVQVFDLQGTECLYPSGALPYLQLLGVGPPMPIIPCSEGTPFAY